MDSRIWWLIGAVVVVVLLVALLFPRDEPTTTATTPRTTAPETTSPAPQSTPPKTTSPPETTTPPSKSAVVSVEGIDGFSSRKPHGLRLVSATPAKINANPTTWNRARGSPKSQIASSAP